MGILINLNFNWMNGKTIVLSFGVLLVLLGISGFFMKPVLGIFAVDTIHNLIHLVSGLCAFALAMKSEVGAKLFAKIFGVVYGAFAILGFTMRGDMIFDFLTKNTADNILHGILALLFLFIGFSRARSTPDTSGLRENSPAVPPQL